MLKLGLVGWPATYSLSPLIFRAAYEYCHIEGCYDIYPTQTPEFAVSINQLITKGYSGVNVTIPLKEVAANFSNKKTPGVQQAQAANLLRFQPSREIIAQNTDIYAIGSVLGERFDKTDIHSVMVLGNGGSARAAVIAMVHLKISLIYCAARDGVKTRAWVANTADEINDAVKIISWEERELLIKNNPVSIIINATSLGWNNTDSFPFQPKLTKDVKYVLDMNYPFRNRWLEEVAKQGTACDDGREVLLRQAARGFEIFTGKSVPLEVLRKSIKNYGGQVGD